MAAFTPEHDNLVSLVREAIAKHGPRPLLGLRRDDKWSWLTFAEVGKLIDDFRGGLASLGVQPKDRVAVISNNRLEWAIGCFAVQSLGATYVPMYENMLDKEWKYILGDCGAKVVLVGSAATEKRLRALLPDLPEVKHVVGFESDDETSYEKLLAKGAAAPAPAVIPTRDEAASIIYTSGTTGNPKGVVLTHWNLATNILGTGSVVPFTPADRSLAFLPWAHVMGGTIELGAIINSGASTAICEDTTKLLDMLPEVQPTILVAVPRIWNRIYDGVQKLMKQKPPAIQKLFARSMAAGSKERRGQPLSVGDRLARFIARKIIYPKIVGRFGGKLNYAVSGSAALSKEVGEFVDNLGITVYEGYGMTESSGVATANSPKGRRVGSVGKPIPGMEIELDHTAPGADEEQGEIVIRGEGVMKEYYGKPDETAATVKHGALRTGDLGKLDKDGFLYITGRVKELYKLENGKYVAPAPLEEKLQLSPFISQAVVHGADKPFNVALIVPDLAAVKGWAAEQGLSSDPMDLLQNEKVRELIKKELERWSEDWKGYERIRKFELLDEEFTTANDMLTPSLKLKRRNVLKKYDPKIKALYG
jgi:long-chain acyl-CoA synthetase